MQHPINEHLYKQDEHLPMMGTFRVTGRFEAPPGTTEYHPGRNGGGPSTGFTLPDGRVCRVILGIEIEDATGNFSEPTPQDLEGMGIIGFGELDLRECQVEPQEDPEC
jgi:hypothetical protein